MATFLQWANGSMKKAYKEFVFFSAGPVGDHVIMIDFANRFFESSGIPSRIIMKHPNAFLRDFAAPYYDHISYLEFKGWSGKLAMLWLALSSIVVPRIYVNVLPIIVPKYYKVFAYFIRFCTRSRFVGYNLEGSKSFPKGKGSSYFLGKEHQIEAKIDTNLFWQEANRMLSFLGYKEVDRPPRIDCIDDQRLLEEFDLGKGAYLVFHLAASHSDRSFPEDKWNRILRELRTRLPETKFVFTGAVGDRKFIEDCLGDISRDGMIMACGKATTQELLTLHKYAVCNVTVHTGNAHFINMLHVPTVTLNIRGVYFFHFYYNEKGTELVSEKDCTCDPFERECTMIPYKGKDYMACLFNIPEENVVQTILKRAGSLSSSDLL
jgi:ADP-heptose:LPS heptosyltransferase